MRSSAVGWGVAGESVELTVPLMNAGLPKGSVHCTVKARVDDQGQGAEVMGGGQGGVGLRAAAAASALALCLLGGVLQVQQPRCWLPPPDSLFCPRH
eukprot:3799637-Rhodomonas_salina.3